MDSDNGGNLPLDPPWRQAVEDFLAEGFTLDDIVARSWFIQHFGLDDPATLRNYQAVKRWELEYLAAFSQFRELMLERHYVAFETVQGKGFRIIPPGRQVALARKQLDKDVRHALRRAAAQMVHVDSDRLTADQQRQRTDELARTATLLGFVGGRRRKLTDESKD